MANGLENTENSVVGQPIADIIMKGNYFDHASSPDILLSGN